MPLSLVALTGLVFLFTGAVRVIGLFIEAEVAWQRAISRHHITSPIERREPLDLWR